jgi:hypothetical protein
VKNVLLRLIFAVALWISSGLVCDLAHAQSRADVTAAVVTPTFSPAFTQSLPSTDASLLVGTVHSPRLLSSPSLVVGDAGDLIAHAEPKTSFAQPAFAGAAWPSPSTPKSKPSTYYEQFPRKWELSLAFALVRFRSSIYEASAPGLNSSLTYWWKDRFAFEGSVTSAFAPPVFANEHFRYLGYGAGPKYSFGRKRLEPWAHALIGGVHVIPQTASGGQNGFEFTMGGGVDYAINDVISAKGGLDYLGTHMFGEWQSSFQFLAGLALRF